MDCCAIALKNARASGRKSEVLYGTILKAGVAKVTIAAMVYSALLSRLMIIGGSIVNKHGQFPRDGMPITVKLHYPLD